MKLVGEAKSELEAALESTVHVGLKARLRKAIDKLESALNYMEDETSSGCTDD